MAGFNPVRIGALPVAADALIQAGKYGICNWNAGNHAGILGSNTGGTLQVGRNGCYGSQIVEYSIFGQRQFNQGSGIHVA